MLPSGQFLQLPHRKKLALGGWRLPEERNQEFLRMGGGQPASLRSGRSTGFLSNQPRGERRIPKTGYLGVSRAQCCRKNSLLSGLLLCCRGKHHDQGKLQRKEVIGLAFSESVHGHHGGDYGREQAGVEMRQSLEAHLLRYSLETGRTRHWEWC